MNASDLHITTNLQPMFRIQGNLVPLQNSVVLTPEDTKRLIHELLDENQHKRLEEFGEVDFSYVIPGTSRFRVNVYKQRKSLAAAVRVILPNIPSLDELGLPEILKTMALKPRGLVLVTGPTGSGKSTTLAAMVRHINTHRNCHVITIEDPIEYLHKHQNCMVNQREIGDDTRSFSNALRAALREDPDVIMVGEMR
ncbi:MAG TPA: type IV pili twitching motility protein PilT, partial [Desulfosporosinus sp.]|nr:type IV pili twitching motility protein PilT [Desulfosporosinus sp.]